MDYFVIGAGAKLLNDTSHKDNVPKDSSFFFWADYSEMGGFAVVHMAVNNMTLEMLDSHGSSLYKAQLFPRHSVTFK